jgi:hypothetical protein
VAFAQVFGLIGNTFLALALEILKGRRLGILEGVHISAPTVIRGVHRHAGFLGDVFLLHAFGPQLGNARRQQVQLVRAAHVQAEFRRFVRISGSLFFENL